MADDQYSAEPGRLLPRRAGERALYRIVRDHLETFRAQASVLRDGEGRPAFGPTRMPDLIVSTWRIVIAAFGVRFQAGTK